MAGRGTRLDALYSNRFDEDHRAQRARVWRVLCESFFQRYIRADDTVLDVGAGFCEFINHVRCGRKLALDLNDDTRAHAAADVEVLKARATGIPLPDEGVDVAFASNFFEHLRDTDEFLDTLREIRRVLRRGGRLLILQPNIRYLPGAYWDFLDHHLPLTDRSLVEALRLSGFRPTEVRARFLPFTTKSRLPQWSWLVRLYLRLPLAHRVFGKQAWVVAEKS